MESLTGEEANPFLQLVMISLIIFGLVIFLKKGQKKRKSVWDDDDVPTIEVPLEAPSMDVFSQESIETPTDAGEPDALPLPEDGLPEGWTIEQWQHYGHQFIEIQESENGQNEK